MRRLLIGIFASVLSLTVVTPLFAQQRLFVLAPDAIIELDPSLASLGRVIRRVPTSAFVSGLTNAPVAVAGGAFLAWADANVSSVALFDTRTGALRHYPVPISIGHVLGVSADGFRVLVDGNERRIYDPQASPLRYLVLSADVRSGAVSTLDLGDAIGISGVLYAPKSDLLFVRHIAVGTPGYVEVRRAVDGAVLKTLMLAEPGDQLLAVSALGTRLFVRGADGALLVVDVASGTVISTAPGNQSGVFLALDEHRQRVLTSTGADLAALSSETLQPLGSVALPPVASPNASAANASSSAVSATLFALQFIGYGEVYGPVTCQQPRLLSLDADTGAIRKTVELDIHPLNGQCGQTMVRLTETEAPIGLAANASARHVDLTWQPESATSYVVEAGTAPGVANIGAFTITEPRLSVDGVPPGTYYVRVRAINVIGSSAASQELQVVVE